MINNTNKEISDNSERKYEWGYDIPNAYGIPMSKDFYYSEVSFILIKLLHSGLNLLMNKFNLANFNNNDLLFNKKIEINSLRDEINSLSEKQLVMHAEKYLKIISEELADSDFLINKKNYNNIFSFIKKPNSAETFMMDEYFSEYFLSGPNPMLIENIEKMPESIKIDLNKIKEIIGDENDNLDDIERDKRLFLIDYKDLVNINIDLYNENRYISQIKGVNTNESFLYVPIVILYKEKNSSLLKPILIKYTQEESSNDDIVYAYPHIDNSEAYWSWQIAKFVARAADETYHELVVHLTNTHLVSEGFGVATFKSFESDHAIYILLESHYDGTFFINRLATKKLLNKDGFIDNLFAPKIEDIQNYISKKRSNLDINKLNFSKNLESRGVLSESIINEYPYRDDGLLIWKSINSWVRNYINIFYTNNDSVAADFQIKNWRLSLINEAKFSNIDEIKTKEQLVELLTIIIFTASAQHAAVNFPQFEYFSYVPASSGVVYGNILNNENHTLSKLYPNINQAISKLNIYYIFSSIYQGKLGEYKNMSLSFNILNSNEKALLKHALLNFRNDLTNIELVIKNRNLKRKYKYEYLLPSNIPASTNI